MSVNLSKNAVRTLSAAAGTAALPVLAGMGLVKPKWRSTMLERFGLGGWEKSRSLNAPIWCHAASVGEFGGLVPVLKQLRELQERRDILVTVTTRTGKEQVLQSQLADACSVLPFDQPLCIRSALRTMRPRLLVISETELWPNLLLEVDRRGIPVVLINARISDYSFPRYQAIDWLLRPVLQTVAKIMTQSALDAERFVLLGADPRAVQVAGSTKYDQPPVQFSPGERESFAGGAGIDIRRPCFVAGSVRPGEEEVVIEAYLSAVTQVPGLQLVIAPRHQERFSAVADLLAAKQIQFARRSAATAGSTAPVLLLDTIGELRKFYGLASVAFVGGTLVDIGGHNPLEPAACSVPVVVGPHTSNVRDAIDSLRKAGAHLEALTAADLARYVIRLSTEEDLRAGLGALSYRVWESNAGATAKVVDTVTAMLSAEQAEKRATA